MVGEGGFKKVLGLVLTVAVLGGVGWFVHALSTNKIVIGYNINYQPEQPIPFSHQLHAGQYKIDCQYCHSSASASRHASVPSGNICMNCHLLVKSDSPLIQQMTKAYNEGRPMEWQKVHLLPDYVRFNHAAHVQAGKQCQECHGPIETMPVVKQVQSLSMGWCVNCHRQPENSKAPLQCAACHY